MPIDDWEINRDTHITEPGDVWTDRLPGRFSEQTPRQVRIGGAAGNGRSSQVRP